MPAARETRVPQTVAAVDLGSNSFHLIVARLVRGEVHVVDRLRHRVALAEGLDSNKRLTRAARDRALACLEIFGQRIRHMPPGSVRAVGTNTLRQARNARPFLARAEKVLGHPVEIVSGREEARLVYIGVTSSIEDTVKRRLVVDIGGGSTECVIGEGLDVREADSLYMGCVSYTTRFFPDGVITAKAMEEAEVAASLELQSIQHRFQQTGWTAAVGSSGTIRAIEAILRATGWAPDGITPKGLRKLRKAAIAAGHASKLDFPGMSTDRAPVLAAGIAILSAIFAMLAIDRMVAAPGALREGVIHDLIGRIEQRDVRDLTIRQLSERYRVEREQSARVEATALSLLDQIADVWRLGTEAERSALSWAARLHEIGLSISHSGYHKHGAYLLEHSDMPGFSRDDQQILATLVLCHRRKIRPSRFAELPEGRELSTFALCLLLRLAVRLNRSRTSDEVPRVALSVKKRTLTLRFPAGWLEEHPLTRADLEEEAAALAVVGYRLRFQ